MAHILVAEDERDIRELLTITLSVMGEHQVTPANDGEEAVRLAQEVKPDMILLDMRMPKMDGLQACRALKALPEIKHIPVVILSGRGLDDEVQAGLDSGALTYIVKPFAPFELLTEINNLLARVG